MARLIDEWDRGEHVPDNHDCHNRGPCTPPPGLSRAAVILRFLRLFRVSHYAGLALIGYVCATVDVTTPDMHILMRLFAMLPCFAELVLIVLSISCAFLALNVLNNVQDLLAGMQKHEVTETFAVMSNRMWWRAGWLLFLVSWLLAALTWEWGALFWIFVYYVIGVLYIMPPFRLKRWYPLSTFLLAGAAVAALLAGFYSVNELCRVGRMPSELITTVLVTFTLSFGTKDRKDIDRDRASGIVTLYTMLGPSGGRSVNAVLVFISYLAVPFLLGFHGLIVLALPFGALSSLVVFSDDEYYREGQVFILYFLFAFALAIALPFLIGII